MHCIDSIMQSPVTICLIIYQMVRSHQNFSIESKTNWEQIPLSSVDKFSWSVVCPLKNIGSVNGQNRIQWNYMILDMKKRAKVYT